MIKESKTIEISLSKIASVNQAYDDIKYLSLAVSLYDEKPRTAYLFADKNFIYATDGFHAHIILNFGIDPGYWKIGKMNQKIIALQKENLPGVYPDVWCLFQNKKETGFEFELSPSMSGYSIFLRDLYRDTGMVFNYQYVIDALSDPGIYVAEIYNDTTLLLADNYQNRLAVIMAINDE